MTIKDGFKFGIGFCLAHLIMVTIVAISIGLLGITGLSVLGYLIK